MDEKAPKIGVNTLFRRLKLDLHKILQHAKGFCAFFAVRREKRPTRRLLTQTMIEMFQYEKAFFFKHKMI